MGDLRTPRLNMRNQKLKMRTFRRPRPNMGEQKSPKLSLDLKVKVLLHDSTLMYMYSVYLC